MKTHYKRSSITDEKILEEGRKITADCNICNVTFYSEDHESKGAFILFLGKHLCECITRNKAGEA